MKVVIFGASGQLGRCLAPGWPHAQVSLFPREVVDVSDLNSVRSAITSEQPDVVINAAAMTDVDGCEKDPNTAFRVNALGPRWLAQEAPRSGALLVQISTDFVFGGRPEGAYHEWDAVRPVQIYGRSKLAGEEEVRGSGCQHLIVRTAWLYGGHARGFVPAILRRALGGQSLRVVEDQVGSPSLTHDVAAGIAKLVASGATGTVHLANAGSVSRFDLAKEILREAGVDVPVSPISSAEISAPALRPSNTSLASFVTPGLGLTMRPWQEALHEFVKEALNNGV